MNELLIKKWLRLEKVLWLMNVECLSNNKNLTESTDGISNSSDKRDCKKRIFCPDCGRYVDSEIIVGGICKDCLKKD